MIKMQIIKYKKNEDYEKELEDYREVMSRRDYGMSNPQERYDYPKKETPNEILDVFITEEQFNAIRKEVIKEF